MDLLTPTSSANRLQNVGEVVDGILRSAELSSHVPKRMLLYFEAARTCVDCLGQERQSILRDIRRCNLRSVNDVGELWGRLDCFLHEDSIRPQLLVTLRGLEVCRDMIGFQFPDGDPWQLNLASGVDTFLLNIEELESLLENLTFNFFPGAGGMGIQTVVPIFNFMSEIRNEFRHGRHSELDFDHCYQQLAVLVCAALRDQSHEGWLVLSAKIEAVLGELELDFSFPLSSEPAEGNTRN